jgi:hypothetical protein
MTLRISTWSGPRNISTALMYSFRQRSDTTVVDEPLYAHYLVTSGVVHPGRDDVLASQSTDPAKVISEVILGDYPTPVVFFKNMAHHLRHTDQSFLSRCTNVILTRDPTDMLTSLTIQVPDATLEGTGLPMQVELLEDILAQGSEPIVVESRSVLEKPRGMLMALCERIGIPFEEAMLSWPAGPKPEDGVWAPHWYHRVHESTGFAPYTPKPDSFPSQLIPLLEQARPLYERLTPYAISARD